MFDARLGMSLSVIGVASSVLAEQTTYPRLAAGATLRYSPAVTETPAIVFEQVSVARGGRPILKRVDLTLERGETVALVGRSGAGKSTILKLVNRLLVPDDGRILV